MEGDNNAPESPRKRVKVSDDAAADVSIPPVSSIETPHAPAPEPVPAAGGVQSALEDAQAMKEAEVGITEFVSVDSSGFTGVLKQRYTDFLVNEILPSGEVLHLRSLAVPRSLKAATEAEVVKPAATPAANSNSQATAEQTKPTQDAEQSQNAGAPESGAGPSNGASTTTAAEIPDEDKKLLEEYFGSDIAQDILILHGRALTSPAATAGDLGRVKSAVITDKDVRTKIHQAIRRIFASRLESTTDNDGAMVISALPARRQENRQKNRGGEMRKGKLGWNELGGEYLHFTIYKENKDTMEVVSYIGRQTKMNAKHFQFAGTKDRRGVTVQRASAFRVHADRLERINRTLRNAAIGDFEYHERGLELGDLQGNEFVITLRDCQFPTDAASENKDIVAAVTELVSRSLRDLRERGYFNYYGLQRFGTFATRTDTVGVKMLQGNFKAACDAILHFNPASIAAAKAPGSRTQMSSDDIARAEAIETFQTTGKVHQAMDKLPKKFSAEGNILRHLGRAPNDYFGALQTIPRNLRLMYVHAYQSLVWNFAVGERWRLYGNKVVEGDLVLVNDFKKEDNKTTTAAAAAADATDAVDADGDAIVLPSATDSAQTVDDMFERARALTAAEAASGTYSVFDIVLPLPGFDIIYPPNEMTEFYKRFMGSERGGGLDPFDMRRKWRDVSLSGGYRKVLSRPGQDCEVQVRRYEVADEQFSETDLERLRKTQQQKKRKMQEEDAEVKDGDEMEIEKEGGGGGEEGKGDKVAVIIKLQLGSSQYATMALRELMKTGGVKTYKPDFGGGR
ncbi:hypothetical protein AJ80_03256 [Polytolypa hystricis UAMH7299]|uniref:TRUD domain-containing protein n=1 Tax=Polytolypa hystricis (strain UAMH7299) TaxID=1447883 RepID=A0A2B7YJI4_POLH7|nr:hypothetical protein AJ80_03256 [Polytolypa hystricis UAMH7299]